MKWEANPAREDVRRISRRQGLLEVNDPVALKLGSASTSRSHARGPR
jgi:hypothetical protein